MTPEASKSLEYWNNIYNDKKTRDEIIVDNWLDQFDAIISNCNLYILDLGCGSGNDTKYLIDKNKRVIACDQSDKAIKNIVDNFPKVLAAECQNMLEYIDFPDDSFGIIIADLSLHYFKLEDTLRILEDIRRILVPEGFLLIRVNSVNDFNHGAGQGKEIEHHLYVTNDGRYKRFFDEADVKTIFKDFDIIFCEEQEMTRYTDSKMLYTVGLRNRK